MNTLYDSDTFCLIHVLGTWDKGLAPSVPDEHRLQRHGFELLDKRSGKEVFLDGPWAELFQEHLQAWQRQSPTQDEVEDTLAQYAGLAQIPTSVH
ncbi:DUF3567 domain-containing protein [Curvibacter sp. APW13]|uniref:BTH_I0359 family protein n=1 Tax=Curvibacter sp. APW13 TaxID=3077236 RepID=UPI0028DFB4AC|nr:DUF3567 domain-containing protein [Curvibacter sp. APW13]MDT8990814.1 DUF3567 domain-containing protein [Curvibacter sp. APW13]